MDYVSAQAIASNAITIPWVRHEPEGLHCIFVTQALDVVLITFLSRLLLPVQSLFPGLGVSQRNVIVIFVAGP